MRIRGADLVVATYNWPVALDRVLRSASGLARQPERIIVADDGSGQQTAEVVRRWQKHFGERLIHSWHEDTGFRLAAARNRALLQGDADLVIFIDGDCLMRPDFIDQHLRLAEAGYAVAGNRILLSEALTRRIESGEVDPLQWKLQDWMQARREGDVGRLFPLLSLPGQGWRRLRSRHWLQFRGCNMGIQREDLRAVNGFEEEMTGWGFEDSDMAIRLLAHGVRIKSGRFATAVLHLWHPERPRTQAESNRQRMLDVKRSGLVTARKGLQQRAN